MIFVQHKVLIICFALILSLAGNNLKGEFYFNIGIINWTHNVIGRGSLNTATYWLERAQIAGINRLPYVLGDSYWRDGSTQSAVDLWGQYAAGPQLVNVATYFIESNNYSVASEWVQKIEALGTCKFDLWFLRAHIAEAKKDWVEALSNYQKATSTYITNCDRFGQSDAFFQIGAILQYQLTPSDRNNALLAYQKAVEFDDFSNPIFEVNNNYRIGQILYTNGAKYDQMAIDTLIEAVTLQPTHSWANLFLGLAIYRKYGEFENAEAYIRTGLKLDKGYNWQFPYFLGELYLAEGHLDIALYYYHQALLMSPTNQRIQNRLQRLETPPQPTMTPINILSDN